MRLSDDVAEASLAVRDDMQNKGIGTELLAFLIERAREAGIKKIVATIQRRNRILWHLIQSANLPIKCVSDGSYTTITADLAGIER